MMMGAWSSRNYSGNYVAVELQSCQTSDGETDASHHHVNTHDQTHTMSAASTSHASGPVLCQLSASCRICFDDDEPTNPLLKLDCDCTGDYAHAHRSCILGWFGVRSMIHDNHMCELCTCDMKPFILGVLEQALENPLESSMLRKALMIRQESSQHVVQVSEQVSGIDENQEVREGFSWAGGLIAGIMVMICFLGSVSLIIILFERTT